MEVHRAPSPRLLRKLAVSATSAPLIRHPGRVRTAQSALLNENASHLITQVREVFCEQTRCQIVRALSAAPLTVNDLASVIQRSKSATSQHLRVLRQAGFVTPRRRGRAVYYSVSRGTAVSSTLTALDIVAAAA